MLKLNSIPQYYNVLDSYVILSTSEILNTKTNRIMTIYDSGSASNTKRFSLQTIDGGVNSFSVDRFRRIVRLYF